MRIDAKLPFLAAVLLGLQCAVNTIPLPSETALVGREVDYHGFERPAQWNFLSRRVPIEEPIPPANNEDRIGSSGDSSVGGGNDHPTAQIGSPESAPVRIGEDPPPPPPPPSGKDSASPPPPPAPIDYTGSLFGDSKDYNSLVDKGRSVDDDLHGTIKASQPDAEIAQLTDNYYIRGQDMNLILDNAEDLKGPFQIINVDLSQAKQTSLLIVSKKGPPSKGTVAGGDFFGDYGTIVGVSRFKVNDLNPADQQMRPSDITYSMWQKVASNKNSLTGKQRLGTTDNINQFRNFVGRNIQSKSTVETMITAHKNTGQSLDNPGVFKRTDTDLTKQTAFQAMLGTDFISSLIHMAGDHHVALGDIHITEIHTFPRAYDPATQTGRQKAAILVMFDTYHT